MPHDVAALQGKIKALEDAVAKLHDAKHATRLLQIIHRPGWTTPREAELVEAHAHSLHNQVTHAHHAFDALLTIADRIGKT
jgi:CHAD domain-containing protein